MPGRAEEILQRREVLGWRLGLERMRRLCSLLGMPQNRFASIHVVGTNGKTSVARMTSALLEAHGVSAGAYVSPHILTWPERILIHGEPIPQDAFDQAVERAEESAQVADRSAGDEGPVTQFELLTAAAFVAFAEARVQYAVVEAGLGGRLDATNVIPSKLTVLTSIGLDHTEYLGETLEEIAAEKLAVLRNHTPLVTSWNLPPEVEPVVAREAESRHAERIEAGSIWGATTEERPPLPGYQQGNLGLAWEAARAALDLSEDEFDDRETTAAGFNALASIPGRAEVIPGDPTLVLDAAHNPEGAAALADLIAEVTGEWRLGRGVRKSTRLRRMRLERQREAVCCLAVLEDKDAAGIVNALAPTCSQFICTEVAEEQIEGSGRPGGKSHPAEELARLCREAGAEAEAIPDAKQAWARARELARERDAVALAAGSHYLLGTIWTERHAESS